MYAISHAATVLALKRRYPTAVLWPLLVSVQAVELLWVIFVSAGVERVTYTRDAVHLGFLPYSHSIATAMSIGLLAWVAIRYGLRNGPLAAAVALGVVSHVVLDIIHHEPDIALWPAVLAPRFGLGLATVPAVDLVVEIAYGVVCWWLFRGSSGLLIAIVAFNLLDLPLMFPRPGAGEMLARQPKLLPAIILVQILLTWAAVWRLARRGPARA